MGTETAPGQLTTFLRKWRRLNPLTLLAIFCLVLLTLLALIGPYLAPHPQDERGGRYLERRLLPPSREFPFGTDDMGRDVFSRVIIGTRYSLRTAVMVVLVAGLVGVALGSVSGYLGGHADNLLMRLTDGFLAIPSLVLALAVAAVLGPSLTNAQLAISFVWWPWYARLVRSQTLALRQREFVEAARAAGASPLRILTRHIIPNCLGVVLVQASLDAGYIILVAAGLGFLGLGAQPPTPEWGLMVSLGRSFFPRSWWVATFPGLAIFLVVLSFNLLGDGLRDYLDPRLRRR